MFNYKIGFTNLPHKNNGRQNLLTSLSRNYDFVFTKWFKNEADITFEISASITNASEVEDFLPCLVSSDKFNGNSKFLVGKLNMLTQTRVHTFHLSPPFRSTRKQV